MILPAASYFWEVPMKSTESIEQLIKDHYSSLSKGCKCVASYVLDHYNMVALLSSTELAEKVGVSDTTVIRFCKSLGFNGYAEFKKSLRSNVYESTMYDTLQDMNVNRNDQSIANYMLSTVEDLQEFARTIDYHMIRAIALILLDSREIFIGGLGSDAVVAKYLFTYVRKMGFNPILLVEEGHTMREYLLNITEEDTLLMCSYPKMFQDEREMAWLAKKGGATLITITESETAALLLGGDYNISIRQREKTFFNSYVLPMAFCNLLLLTIYDLAPEKVDESLKRYTEIINRRDITLGT